MKKLKLIFAVLAVSAALAALTGCSGGNDNGETTAETSQNASNAENTSETNVTGEEMPVLETGTRPLEEGDDYAINKINNTSPEDSLPGGYKLQDYTEEQQGKLFVNGKAKIIIRAYNYKEDLQELSAWADNACAVQRLSNIMKNFSDTMFSEPENTKVLGFDAIKYNYTLVNYGFSESETDEKGEKLKIPLGTYKGIAYFFYSDQDAYSIMFDTAEADWEEQSKLFEEFIDDLEITKTEY